MKPNAPILPLAFVLLLAACGKDRIITKSPSQREKKIVVEKNPLCNQSIVLTTENSPVDTYYGEGFFKQLSQLPKTEQKSILQKRLARGHSPLGYVEARNFLFGMLHLEIKRENKWVRTFRVLDITEAKTKEFAIFDIYEDRKLTKTDFPEKKAPTPLVSIQGLGAVRAYGIAAFPDHRIMNTEHTWPKSRFNKTIARDIQVSDLHHLFPSNNKLNADRSSHRFGETVNCDPHEACLGSVIWKEGSHENKLGATDENGVVFKEYNHLYFSPPAKSRGNIARALFYFSLRYKLKIGEKEKFYLKKWNLDDPVDENEIKRNNAIEKIQGNRNPFIDFYPELMDLI